MLEGDCSLYGAADEAGYSRFSRVARSLLDALAICSHDQSLLQAEYLDSLVDYQSCAKTLSRLLTKFDPASVEKRLPVSEHLDDGVEAKMYHAVIDYTSAVLVKSILRAFRSDYWINNTIAILARIIAKIKVIGADLPQAVKIMAQLSSDASRRISRYLLLSPQAMGEKIGQESTRVPLSGEAVKYFSNTEIVFTLATSLLEGAFSKFSIHNPIATPINEFESSTALYQSRITGDRALICQDRSGGIGAANRAAVIEAFTATYLVCVEAWESITPTGAPDPSHWTSVQ